MLLFFSKFESFIEYQMAIQLLVHITFILLFWQASSAAPPLAKPNCQTHCGNVSIPYPFGIGPDKDCYFDEWFQIDCNKSTINKPFLSRTQLEVLNIFNNGTLRVNNPVTFFSCKGKEIRQPANLTGSPFVYSQTTNRFTAVSCGLLATVSSDGDVIGGCMSTCDQSSTDNRRCDLGINCCQTTIPPFLSVINTEIISNGTGDCNYAFLVHQDWLVKTLSNFRAVQSMDSVPVVLEWRLSLDNINSSLIKSFERFIGKTYSSYNDSTPFCSIDNATSSTYNLSSLQCFCPVGFEGNPYLLQPCQDIDECLGSNRCMGSDLNTTGPICENFVGGYTCYSDITGATCEYTFGGGAPNTSCYFRTRLSQTSGSYDIKTIVLGLGVGLGLLLLLIGAWWVHKVIRKRKNIKQKEMFFKRNGGLLLQQQLSSGEVNVEKIKLFKSKELEKSTDNYNMDRILGQGGQGTVYKGMLADGRIVAVKKSKIVDAGKLSEFINEVVILSQINHRNVVQLLGCCLETEVPLLVYEFIPNGTLSQYIQEQIEEFPLTWGMRLRIATEIAGALSYLHSAASFPIYHRDIKSTNILLDEKYRAKVADFGTSRSVVIGQTHLTTLVHGTFGYLDPEYFQSSQFTEKSDVYSFGVVLVELLTGQKPICEVARSTQEEEQEYRSLAMYFIISMQEDRLFEILDPRVLKEGSETEIRVVANLARRCLNLNGRKRPTMREVTAELEIQMSSTEKTCNGELNYQEVNYVRTDSKEPWDVVSCSTGTGSASDGGPTSSLLDFPQLSFNSR